MTQIKMNAVIIAGFAIFAFLTGECAAKKQKDTAEARPTTIEEELLKLKEAGLDEGELIKVLRQCHYDIAFIRTFNDVANKHISAKNFEQSFRLCRNDLGLFKEYWEWVTDYGFSESEVRRVFRNPIFQKAKKKRKLYFRWRAGGIENGKKALEQRRKAESNGREQEECKYTRAHCREAWQKLKGDVTKVRRYFQMRDEGQNHKDAINALVEKKKKPEKEADSFKIVSGKGSGGSTSFSSAAGKKVGMATGGAKDVNTMRENIKNGYLLRPSAITCEGLFYDYYFDTGTPVKTDKLFAPAYSMAISPDPLSDEKEFFMTVGLTSNIDVSEFQRKKLNLVIVLDISGSMSSAFSRYYYDGPSTKKKKATYGSKISLARDALRGTVKQLKEGDQLGLVIFNNHSTVVRRLAPFDTDLRNFTDLVVRSLKADGGTKLSAGMKKATKQFSSIGQIDPTKRENRIIFITDAMPNMGTTGKGSLHRMFQDNAKNGIYTTFLGIGIDFQTDLVETITKTRGANYYCPRRPDEFKKRLGEEFAFMVTPLVFDLNLRLNAKGYSLEKAYGAPSRKGQKWQVMHVDTLFASPTKEEGTRGGVILLKLDRQDAREFRLGLEVTYTDRTGERHRIEQTAFFPSTKEKYYDNSGIRKALLLARYADLLKHWCRDERRKLKNDNALQPSVSFPNGIPVAQNGGKPLGKWEQKSVKLNVSPPYTPLFRVFLKHMRSEMKSIDDDTLQQEIELLKKLLEVASPIEYETPDQE
ncbi:MAG: vWA domain-containing protein [Candidatus Brocadiia bacterium]